MFDFMKYIIIILKIKVKTKKDTTPPAQTASEKYHTTAVLYCKEDSTSPPTEEEIDIFRTMNIDTYFNLDFY